MARINLLPWREERRQKRQQEFLALLGLGALAAVGIALLVFWHIDGLVNHQRYRNTYLEQEIKKLDVKIKAIEKLEETREKLLTRKRIIEELQASRSQMVHLFDALVRTIPDGTQLASIKQNGDTLTLAGKAQSNARVSAYLRNLEKSDWLKTPDLTVIEEIKSSENSSYRFRFELTVKLRGKPGEDEDQEVVEA